MCLIIFVLLLVYSFSFANCSHEVLRAVFDSEVDQFLLAQDILIAQYDSRPLSSYWNLSFNWNNNYSAHHNHQYLIITKENLCQNCRGEALAEQWCKVQAMVAVDNFIWTRNSAQAVLFLDSDALITVNYSMSKVIFYMSQSLQWDRKNKPIAFNQDGPGYACKLAVGLGYKRCLNSGIVFWWRDKRSTTILRAWWHSTESLRNTTAFPMDWRRKWPWEQAPQHELFSRYNESIQLLSFPNLTFLPWKSTKNPKSQYPTDSVEPWCFSHWPGASCFITHFCASPRQKQKMLRDYSLLMLTAIANGYVSKNRTLRVMSIDQLSKKRNIACF